MTTTTSWYATRERVKRALDAAETTRNDTAVDAALAAAVGRVDSLCRRAFTPWHGTRTFDNDLAEHVVADRLYLGQHDLISATTVSVDGTALAAADYVLCPQDGPPYRRVDLSDSASSTWSRSQRGNSIAGVWGHSDNAAAGGALAAAVTTTTATTITVTDGSRIGVGDLIRVDDERLVVTGRTMADTGVDIDATDALTASVADVGIICSTTVGMPTVGETILIDAERMLVVDTAGSLLVVRRAWDGTVLAAHAAGASIWTPRTLTVVRGAAGTTAATHLIAAAITVHTPPALVSALAVAEAMDQLLQEGSGYARQVGTGESSREYWGRALAQLRDQVRDAYGRQARTGAV